MSKEYVLITGASGLVGSQAVDYFLNKHNFEIIATDINYPPFDLWHRWVNSSNFNFFKIDLRKSSQFIGLVDFLQEKLMRFSPEYSLEERTEGLRSRLTVLHIGGVFDYLAPEQLLFDVNVGGTQNLINALKIFADRIKRVVIWSGGVVYGNFDFKLPAVETSPVNPQNAYGRSKSEQERIAFLMGKQLNIPVTAMRLGAIYGPRSRYGMGSCILLYANGQLSCFVFGKGNNRVALVHALDTVRAAWFLSNQSEAVNQIYNVVDDCPHAMMNMATFLGQELNNPVYQRFRLPKFVFEIVLKNFEKAIKKLKVRPMVDSESAAMLKVDNWMSNEKLKTLGFKFKYPDGIIGLKETIEWYRKEEWI